MQTTSDTPAEPKLDARFTYIVQNERVEGIVLLILTVFIVGLTMLPTAVLFVLPSHGMVKIVLVILFTLLFCVALSIFTKAYVDRLAHLLSDFVLKTSLHSMLLISADVRLLIGKGMKYLQPLQRKYCAFDKDQQLISASF